MADVDLRVRPRVRPRAESAGLSTALVRLPRRASRRAWPTLQVLWRPLAVYLVSRIAVALAIGVVIMLKLGVSNFHFAGPWPTNPPGRPLFEALGMWDGGWYIRIAQHGFTTTLHPPNPYTPTVAFLPLLPVLLRIAAFITGLNMLYAGVLTAFVIGAVASVCVWFFVRWLTDTPTADRATALWCFFPGAVTLSLVYTEGLLVILAVICLYALMRGRWVIAGIAAAGASATSPEGLALFACCAWAAGAAILRRPDETASDGPTGPTPARPHRRWPALVAPLLAPLGWLTYQGYLWRRTGDLTIWYQVEKLWWHGGFDPTAATVDKVRLAIRDPGVPDHLVPAIGLFILAAAAILLWRWKPPAVVTIYAAVTMALVLVSGPIGARPRFFIAAFPFLVAFARPVRGSAYHALLGISAVCLGLLTIILVSGGTTRLAFTP